MGKDLLLKLERETLLQLAPSQLVDIIVEQAIAIEKLNSRILELEEKVEKLKVSRDLDSSTSSKPPSGDILKKTENKQQDKLLESEAPKRKPGGQPGHQGKTRSGFGRVDRYEILRPEDCLYCGQKAFATVAVKIEKQSVAQLVEHPIEIVEYQRQTCVCECCGNRQTASWSPDIVPGQDLGVRLQAFLGWVNNYAHMPYEKQQEMLWELGQIDIGLGTLVATNEHWVNQFKSKLQSSVEQWINLAGATAGHLLRSLRDKANQWWYFLDYPEVPPDNNQAERSLRLAVTKRKVSGGSRSMDRFKHTAHLLTVVQTCRRQGRAVIDFFVQALLANSNSYLSRPSLLPKY